MNKIHFLTKSFSYCFLILLFFCPQKIRADYSTTGKNFPTNTDNTMSPSAETFTQLYTVHTVQIRLNESQFNSLYWYNKSLSLPPISVTLTKDAINLLNLSVVSPFFPGDRNKTLSFTRQGIISGSDSLSEEIKPDSGFFVPLSPLSLAPQHAQQALYLPNKEGEVMIPYCCILNKSYTDYSKGYPQQKSKPVRMIVDVTVMLQESIP